VLEEAATVRQVFQSRVRDHTGRTLANQHLRSGLWIRIDLLQIRIQHFCSIRIRIQAITELSQTISFSNFFDIKI
jgi:hypothetical protein